MLPSGSAQDFTSSVDTIQLAIEVNNKVLLVRRHCTAMGTTGNDRNVLNSIKKRTNLRRKAGVASRHGRPPVDQGIMPGSHHVPPNDAQEIPNTDIGSLTDCCVGNMCTTSCHDVAGFIKMFIQGISPRMPAKTTSCKQHPKIYLQTTTKDNLVDRTTLDSRR